MSAPTKDDIVARLYEAFPVTERPAFEEDTLQLTCDDPELRAELEAIDEYLADLSPPKCRWNELTGKQAVSVAYANPLGGSITQYFLPGLVLARINNLVPDSETSLYTVDRLAFDLARLPETPLERVRDLASAMDTLSETQIDFLADFYDWASRQPDFFSHPLEQMHAQAASRHLSTRLWRSMLPTLRGALRHAVTRAKREQRTIPFRNIAPIDDAAFSESVHAAFPVEPIPTRERIARALQHHEQAGDYYELTWPNAFKDPSKHAIALFMLPVEDETLYFYYLPALLLASVNGTTGLVEPKDRFAKFACGNNAALKENIHFLNRLTEAQLTVFEHYLVRRLRALPPDNFDPYTRDAVQLLRALKILQLRLWRYLDIP